MKISSISNFNFQQRYKFQSKTLPNFDAFSTKATEAIFPTVSAATGLSSVYTGGSILSDQLGGTSVDFEPFAMQSAKETLSEDIINASENHPYLGAIAYSGVGASVLGSNIDELNKLDYKVEMIKREASSTFSSIANREFYQTLKDKFDTVQTKEDYFKVMSWLGKTMANTREVEINTQSGILRDIAQSGEPCIFIMNHPSQKNDPWLMMALNSFLADAYINNYMSDDAPVSKFIINKDIISSNKKSIRTLYEKIGAVGVDTRTPQGDLAANVNALEKVMQGFINNKNHIFIFPEGKNAVKQNATLQERMQNGTSSLIVSLLKRTGRVKVVPVGFAYDDNSNPDVGSIHLCQPIIFEYDDKISKEDKTNLKNRINSAILENLYPAIEKAQDAIFSSEDEAELIIS